MVFICAATLDLLVINPHISVSPWTSGRPQH